MDAIEYLTEQHREIGSLFDQIASAVRIVTRRRLRRKLFDLVAVHAALEEMIFYPAAGEAAVEQLLPRAFEEHLSLERMIARIVAPGGAGGEAAARMSMLQGLKRRHADAEEQGLFPAVRRMLTPEQLEDLGEHMASVAERLMAPGVGARERVAARRALA
jgi:hypothetical protein